MCAYLFTSARWPRIGQDARVDDARVPLRISLDETVNAAYVYFADEVGPGAAVKTVCVDPIDIGGMVNIDLDAEGRIIGIEVLDATGLLPASLVAQVRRAQVPFSSSGTRAAKPTRFQYIYLREPLDPTPASRTMERTYQYPAIRSCVWVHPTVRSVAGALRWLLRLDTQCPALGR